MSQLRRRERILLNVLSKEVQTQAGRIKDLEQSNEILYKAYKMILVRIARKAAKRAIARHARTHAPVASLRSEDNVDRSVPSYESCISEAAVYSTLQVLQSHWGPDQS